MVTPSLRALALEPWKFAGQTVTVTGNFRGRNLFGDLPDAPGKGRYDFIVRGGEGSVWVTGMRPRGSGFDFDVDRRIDSNRWLEVTGPLVHDRGLVRIEATKIALAKAPEPDRAGSRRRRAGVGGAASAGRDRVQLADRGRDGRQRRPRASASSSRRG